MGFLDFVEHIYRLLFILNVFLYFKSYRGNFMAFKIISFYLFYVLILELYSSYLAAHKTPNGFISHYYFIGQFVLLSLFYNQVFIKKKLKRIIKGVLITVLGYVLHTHLFNCKYSLI